MSTEQSAPAASEPSSALNNEASNLDKAAKEVIDTLETEDSAEESEELDSEESEESEESDSKDEAKKEPKKEKKSAKASDFEPVKIKVGDKEVEIKDRNELIKRAQMGYSADEKWQEAAKMRKDMESFVKALQSDPAAVLEQMGFDVDSIAEQRIQQRIEEMQKSPEQLEREKLQRELEELKKRDQAREEELRTKEMERLQQQYAIEIENEISHVLDTNKTLPKSPYVVKRIADSLLLAMNNGYHDVTVADVLPLVESQIKSEIQSMFSAMPEELVEAVVGKDVLNKIRKSRIKKSVPAKPKVEATGQTEIAKTKDNTPNQQRKVSAKDFFKKLGSY